MMQAKTERPQRGGRDDHVIMTNTGTRILNTDADKTIDEKSED